MINAVAPAIMLSQLAPLLTPQWSADNDQIDAIDALSMGHSFVVNVTSHEGQFCTSGKTDHHIHTNISKACLNMLTRTSSHYYAKMGILINSVDTGWVSSALPTFKEPPLTLQDATKRILHPILIGSFEYGKLYKNYKVVDW